MRFPFTSRRGFTRFDLLVLAAVLVISVGVLMPAAQRVREAANLAQCRNNIHDIALGSHNIWSTHNTLPPSVGPMPKTAGDGTVLFHVLPFLNLGALYDRGVDRAGNPSPWGGGVYATPVDQFLCPSDATGGAHHRFQEWLATSSYAANYLVFGLSGGFLPPDGSSMTIMFAERYQICNSQPCAWAFSGESEQAPLFAYSSYAKFQMMPTKDQCNPALPQSPHRVGIQVGMCDGSVHTVAPTLSPLTWYHMCTPNGGESRDPDWIY
jgi:Protein of unknown function (DUF1559)